MNSLIDLIRLNDYWFNLEQSTSEQFRMLTDQYEKTVSWCFNNNKKECKHKQRRKTAEIQTHQCLNGYKINSNNIKYTHTQTL